MYDHFCYDVQVRYALGYRDLSEGHFELRTMYNFRKRVTKQMQETGENLFEQTFEQITDEQIVAFKLKTDKLRMDSTMVASNIRETTRVAVSAAGGGFELPRMTPGEKRVHVRHALLAAAKRIVLRRGVSLLGKRTPFLESPGIVFS